MSTTVAPTRIKDIMKVPLFTLGQVFGAIATAATILIYVSQTYQTKDDAGRDRADFSAQISELKTQTKEQSGKIDTTLNEVKEISGFLKAQAAAKKQ